MTLRIDNTSRRGICAALLKIISIIGCLGCVYIDGIIRFQYLSNGTIHIQMYLLVAMSVGRELKKQIFH